MEVILAKKLEELNLNELISLLTKLNMQDRDAFLVLKELVEDT
jgi:hypothetical protein